MAIHRPPPPGRPTPGWIETLGVPAAPLAVADDCELDVMRHELRHAGAPVHLRPREYTLLATFATNPGRAFSRRELVDLAWGVDHAIGLRAVDVHIHWLRSKIEPDPRRPAHLVTIRGFGYRLDPALTNP